MTDLARLEAEMAARVLACRAPSSMLCGGFSGAPQIDARPDSRHCMVGVPKKFRSVAGMRRLAAADRGEQPPPMCAVLLSVLRACREPDRA